MIYLSIPGKVKDLEMSNKYDERAKMIVDVYAGSKCLRSVLESALAEGLMQAAAEAYEDAKAAALQELTFIGDSRLVYDLGKEIDRRKAAAPGEAGLPANIYGEDKPGD